MQTGLNSSKWQQKQTVGSFDQFEVTAPADKA